MFMSFAEMETRFGTVAHHYLQEIEKAARLAPNLALDPEARLVLAFAAQDAALAAAGAGGAA